MNNSAKFSLEEILAVTGGQLIADAPAASVFCGVSTDSRLIVAGNIFVALKGDNYDGHNFVAMAFTQGAAGVLIQDEKIINATAAAGKAIIKVADTLQALGDLAHCWRKKFAIPVIALTGSSGKTTTKEMIAAILGRQKNVLKTEGNLNNLIGLPQTIFRLTKEHEIAILEMGTNTPGEIKRLTEIAAPDIGLIVNVGPAHLAGFGSVEAIRDEKGELFYQMDIAGQAVINIDDEAIRVIAERWKGRRITFGLRQDADVTANNIEKNGAKGVRFDLSIGGKTQKTEMKIVGIHHIYNALAAAAVAAAAGIELETIKDSLADFQPVGGRMQIIKLPNGAFVIDDSYNANPASVREALMTLKDLKNHHNCYVFLGDMLELGDAAAEMHRKIGTLMATIGVNTVFLKGEYAAHTSAGAKEGGLPAENIFLLQDAEEAVAYLTKHLKKGDWVLVKGSRRMKMDAVIEKISEAFAAEKINSNNKTVH